MVPKTVSNKSSYTKINKKCTYFFFFEIRNPVSPKNKIYINNDLIKKFIKAGKNNKSYSVFHGRK